MSDIIPLLIKEIKQEAEITRKFLQRTPLGNPEYKPHDKSMPIMKLSVHIAGLQGWVKLILETDELDFATSPFKPVTANNNEELLLFFETSLEGSLEALQKAQEEDLTAGWKLRAGDIIFANLTKYEAIRNSIAHIIHHRAQLGVYLRLLNVPIPGSYGPSADEPRS